MCLQATDWPTLIAAHYPEATLRRPAQELEGLVDLSALWRDLGWRPTDPPLTLTVE